MSPGGGAGELNEMKGWCYRQDAGVKVAVILQSKVFSQRAGNFIQSDSHFTYLQYYNDPVIVACV